MTRTGGPSNSATGVTSTLAKPPSLRFLFAHPAHFIACGLGSGLSPWAPGTVGTLFAWLTYLLIRPYFSDGQFALLLGFACLGGMWAIQKAGIALGEPDHGSIVWDEIVPFWGVLFLTPATFLWQGAAFCLFRCFDITKPQPARWFDRKIKNGFGVMMDDVVAGAYTLLALACLKWALG